MILILDDDEQVRESLRLFLADEGFQTTGCVTAEEALILLEKEQITLAVVDLRLPGMNGISFIETASSHWPDLKYIIYTGSLEIIIPQHIAALSQVSDHMFLKPLIDLNEMYNEISSMLAK